MKYAILVLMSVLTGCALSIDGERYAKLKPAFKPERFFDGNVKAWGIVQNRSGNMVQQFEVDIVGRVEGSLLILDETFHYHLGEGVDSRTWKIQLDDAGSLSGSASDIPGPAKGNVIGNAMSWFYQMDLPVEGSTYRVGFEDWMWAFDETRLMNRSYIKKFGLVMAEVTIFMERME